MSVRDELYLVAEPLPDLHLLHGALQEPLLCERPLPQRRLLLAPHEREAQPQPLGAVGSRGGMVPVWVGVAVLRAGKVEGESKEG